VKELVNGTRLISVDHQLLGLRKVGWRACPVSGCHRLCYERSVDIYRAFFLRSRHGL
jgi:hypothetical protein